MKKERPPVVRSLPVLYGLEHGGNALPELCAPATQLDFTTGGFEYVSDGYYNGPPRKRDSGSNWVVIKPGLRVTKSLDDVEELLKKLEYSPQVTPRCLEELLRLGYVVVLRRSQTRVTQHTLEADITYQGSIYSDRMRIVKDEITHKQFNGGKPFTP